MLLKIIVSTLIVGFIVVAATAYGYYLYLNSTKFGKNPQGEDLERIKKSPNYYNNKFNNRHPKPRYSQGHFMPWVHFKFLFQKSYRQKPLDPIPHQVTDLGALDPKQNWLVWFGHSAMLLNIDGIKYLIDPSLCPYVSPFSWAGKAFKGADYYQPEMIPEFDYLLISHDHPDMLDYGVIGKLKGKFKKVICGLGVGSHFRHWGFDPQQIVELDWGDQVALEHGHTVHAESAHHGSRRNHQLHKTLWLSLVLITPDHKIYYSGDGGYDDSFALAGEKYGPFDLAIIECGQYDPAWESIHIHPDQVVLATQQLGAKKLLPVHHSKFDIAHHQWDDPLEQMTRLAVGQDYQLLTPMIGEVVYLNKQQSFSQWWKGVR